MKISSRGCGLKLRRCRLGETSPSSSEPGVTIIVRPEDERKINLPSEVMPTTRARVDFMEDRRWL
jgi:hypothetical protein